MPNGLLDRQVAEVGSSLQHDAESATPQWISLGRIVVEDRDLAAVTVPIPLEDLGGGRLAGAVGTEQRQHLAAYDVEVDAIDGLGLAVVLAQATYPHGEISTVGDGHEQRAVRGGGGHGSSLPQWRPGHSEQPTVSCVHRSVDPHALTNGSEARPD